MLGWLRVAFGCVGVITIGFMIGTYDAWLILLYVFLSALMFFIFPALWTYSALIGFRETRIFNALPNPSWLIETKTGKIRRANPAAVAQYGFAQEEFRTMTLAGLDPIKRTGPINPADTLGSQYHVTRSGQLLLVNVSEVTVNYRMLLVTASQPTLLGELTSPRGIPVWGRWESDLEQTRIMTYPNLGRALGLEAPGPLTLAQFAELVHEEDRDGWYKARQSASSKGWAACQYRLCRPTTEGVRFHEIIQVTAGHAGSEAKLSGLFMEITQLEQAGAAKTLYYAFLAKLPYGVLSLRDGRIHFATPAAQRIFNPENGFGFIGGDIASFLDPDNKGRELDRLRALQCGQVNEAQFRRVSLRRLNGEPFVAEVTEVVIKESTGTEIQLLVKDVSDAEKMRIELEEANYRLQHLSQRLIALQESQQTQLARDLHDDIGQQLTGLKLHLLRLSTKLELPEHQSLVNNLVRVVEETLNKVRTISLSLHPLQLETLGLEAAVRWHLSQFLSATDIQWDLYVEGDLSDIPDHRALAAFRLVQEAVSNVIRHANASKVQIRICRRGEQLTVEVLDDGGGFDVAGADARASSLGLTSMRERIAALQGSVRISSMPGMGTRVHAEVPMQDEDRRYG